jgi:RimJ/RimL family protein N-acetyltransferase
LRLPEDIETALGWYQDPEVLFYSEGPGVTGFNRTRIERMYRWLLDRGEVFFIEVEGFEGTWQPVGDVALCETMIPIVIGEAQYRNRGVGSHALAQVIEVARDHGWTKLVAHKIFSYNLRSMQLFEKAGFVRTATRMDENGQSYAVYEKML